MGNVSRSWIFKSVDPDGLHARVLRELTDVNTRKILIIFEKLWETSGGF